MSTAAPAPAPAGKLLVAGLPEGPYPGLRPFLAHEEILLFGRERQVREVLARLREAQFVAVIGGSGSGKSSLILAGVVPELRSFAIEGAGDFWVPLVSTPGTNASAEDQAERRNTPITRLARKFGALLKSRGSPQADEQRVADIAACLRDKRGFAKLVRRYSPELAVDAGPNPEDARFLFVLDQFEELFHPTTRKSEDANLLIERVIDHFFSPNERCFVVLTMRSEHLNDCTGYLELPDAINKASYLVRRLDTDELRAAITGPAQRLLRLHQRLDREGARLPEAVEFEPAVVQRLLDDTRALHNNPDHLPLLQHTLARLWEAAARRTAATLDLPDLITLADLAVATTAQPQGQAAAPPDGVNTLTESLEHWAEAAYARYDAADRARLDQLLRRLGVKDPNTGMYSQERIQVDEAAQLLALPGGRNELKALLGRAFLDELDYLFWDDAEPERATLKVSHESFIRGWPRLRQAINREADRFDVFVDLLRKAAGWQAQGQRDDDLLDAGDLRRAEGAGLPAVLAEAPERQRWFRRLESTHAHAHLVAVANHIGTFLQASQGRQQGRVQDLKRRKRNRIAGTVLALLAVPPLAYWTLVQGPVVERTSLMFQAGAQANSTPLRDVQTAIGSEAGPLATLLQAAATLDRGIRGEGALAHINSVLLDRFSGLPFVSAQARFVEQVRAGNETVVNGSLRDQLQAWLWAGDLADAGDAVRLAEVTYGATCDVQRQLGAATGAAGAPVGAVGSPAVALGAGANGELQRESRSRLPLVQNQPTKGTLLTARNPNVASGALATRSVFVPDAGALAEELEIRSASVDAQNRCVSRQQILPIPRALNPVIAFDANLRNLFYVTEEDGALFTTVVEIDWEQDFSDNSYTVNKLAPVVLTGADEARRLMAEVRANAKAPPSGPVLLDTRRVTAGRMFVVQGQGWRIVDELAQRVPWDVAKDLPANAAAAAPFPFEKLAAASGTCAGLAQQLEQEDQATGVPFTTRAFVQPADERYCFIAKHGVPGRKAAAPGVAAPIPAGTYQLVAAVYPRPTQAQLDGARLRAQGQDSSESLPAPIARMPRFSRTPDGPRAQWWVGRPGTPYAGWLATLSPDRSGQWRLVAAPWSTCALWRLGQSVSGRPAGTSLQGSTPATTAVSGTCAEG